ncbi:GGDEF domain-containing protein [Natronospira bacteriovora]|uniref:diguanylate cyclase n=1 Tax=Natronospira bacteriovora TaxID=3069753 RepID=A0ABU0W644_9GAMM|nr:GGDEF domain-containing protein [Natronospira sp. AB-CW4]MDQ2069238.1 GGDEF domain-containing protein [Natronospira sp. AB-CW4]
MQNSPFDHSVSCLLGPLLRAETPAEAVAALHRPGPCDRSTDHASAITGVELDAGDAGRWSRGEWGTPLLDGDLVHDGQRLGRLRVFGKECYPCGEALAVAAPLVIAAISRILALHVAEQRAFLDGLTGCLNRSGLDHFLDVELQRAERSRQPLSVILLDVDNLKRVNDECGHAIGDRMLTVLAGILNDRLRGVDRVARLGGDEFVVILPDTNASGAETVRAKIEDGLNRAAMAPGVSMGVSEYRPGDNRGQLLDRADQAMYRCKAARKKQPHVA